MIAPTIDRNFLCRNGACYGPDRIDEILGGRGSFTVREVVDLEIPWNDRLWVLSHALAETDHRLCVKFASYVVVSELWVIDCGNPLFKIDPVDMLRMPDWPDCGRCDTGHCRCDDIRLAHQFLRNLSNLNVIDPSDFTKKAAWMTRRCVSWAVRGSLTQSSTHYLLTAVDLMLWGAR